MRMRRLLPIAALSIFLAVPLWAQHGGGHAGGGHAGGFSGGHGGFSGGHVSGGVRSGSGGFAHGSSFAARGNFSQRSSSQRRSSHDGSRHRRSHTTHTYGLRNYCYGYGCRTGYVYPYAYGGYYDPYWWGDSDSNDQGYERDRALANDMNAESLEQQFQQQQMLRQEQADGDQDAYARPVPRPSSRASSDEPPIPIVPATVLVFRDQRKQEVRNYAIVGQTLWNFAPQRTEKIPLADLDLTATAKANDDRGVTFHVPIASEAQ